MRFAFCAVFFLYLLEINECGLRCKNKHMLYTMLVLRFPLTSLGGIYNISTSHKSKAVRKK
jgi:hypothetical protein